MTHLTEETFEQTLQSFIRSEEIDLRDVSFIDPYGMVGLLEIGELCMLEDVRKTVILPQSDEVRKYLERMDFSPTRAGTLCSTPLRRTRRNSTTGAPIPTCSLK